jgi:hypothetical protein
MVRRIALAAELSSVTGSQIVAMNSLARGLPVAQDGKGAAWTTTI